MRAFRVKAQKGMLCMKIGIIVYSQSGHTLTVAEQLVQTMRSEDCEAVIREIKAAQTEQKGPPNANPELIQIPDITEYDIVIFGSPVQGFSLALPMVAYLRQIPSLQGKKVACFATQHLKHAWMGGNRAIQQMKAACAEKNGDASISGIVHWSSPKREEQIKELVDTLCKIK